MKTRTFDHECFICGGEVAPSEDVRAMVKAFEQANNLTLPYKIVDRRPGDLATCYADPTKSAEMLGWTLDELISRTILAMRATPAVD